MGITAVVASTSPLLGLVVCPSSNHRAMLLRSYLHVEIVVRSAELTTVDRMRGLQRNPRAGKEGVREAVCSNHGVCQQLQGEIPENHNVRKMWRVKCEEHDGGVLIGEF